MFLLNSSFIETSFFGPEGPKNGRLQDRFLLGLEAWDDAWLPTGAHNCPNSRLDLCLRKVRIRKTGALAPFEFVCIDVSKDKLDVAFLGAETTYLRFPNSSEGFAELAKNSIAFDRVDRPPADSNDSPPPKST